ncbi:MAG: SRPBCC family protein [Sulfuricurvum sp.]|nr:SRPBCC family protein [Sulfuricurvum sp.]
MKLHTLKYSCLLTASQEAVCQFHTDTHNLPLITPPWINVTIVQMDTPMVENSHVILDIKRYGLTTRWTMQIEKLFPPDTIIDLMISGPFAFFRHERRFIAISENETRMDETLAFCLPLGWIGNLLAPFIKKDMDKMFAYRHNATQNYFSPMIHFSPVGL